MPPDERTPRAAHCPRCGYDLRGTVATWSDSCPLEGVCNECGLGIIWAEVLCPEKFEPRWSIEFEPKTRRVPLTAVKTYLRSFWPWGFWSRLKMSDEVRWGRLALYVCALLFGSLLLLYLAEQTTVALYARSQYQNMLDQEVLELQISIQSIEQTLTGATMEAEVPKGWVTTLTRDLKAAQQMLLQQARANPPQIDLSVIEAVAEAVFFPFAESSRGKVRDVGGGWRPYVAPADLYAIEDGRLYILGWRRWPRSPLLDAAIRSGAMLFAGFLGTLLLPIGFVLLPVSRRRSKVRWRHIGRVFLYSVFIPVTATVLAGAAWIIAIPLADFEYAATTWMGRVATYGPWIGLAVWWAAAIRCYLRIPHAEVVAILMTWLAIMLIVAAVWFTYPNLLIDGLLRFN